MTDAERENAVDLSSKVAIVTGGASGIGRATAELLARCGADVTIGDFKLRPSDSDSFAERKIQQQQCDVRDVTQLQRLIDGTVERAGRLDILVSNAGVGLVKQAPDVEEQEWDRCIDTNLKAVFFGARFAIPHLKRAGGGCIVNMASNAGLLPRAHDPVYSISKQAVVGLTKSLALCHAPDRIRVNCICPGPVEATALIEEEIARFADQAAARERVIAASPLSRAWGRMIHSKEVAQAVLYLASDAAQMVTGTALAIDGGKSLGVPPAASES